MGKKIKARRTPRLSMPKVEQPPLPASDMPDRDGQGTIVDLVSSLYLNSEYSDLVIVCQGKTFPAHRALVCCRSEYFRKACFGDFKEAKDPIHLDNTDPVLVEKVLEFLYKDSYTIGYISPQARYPPVDSSRRPEIETEHAGEHAATEVVSESGEGTNEDTKSLDNIAQDSVNEESPSGQGSVMDAAADCHPSYFHARMFGEADYFMINALKAKAKSEFRASFKDCSERDLIAEVIKELYSPRANYQELRKLAVDVVVNNLPSLREGFPPAIDFELLKTVPDFAIELCLATVDRYASKGLETKPSQIPTGAPHERFGFPGGGFV
ncbi:BTB/POZ domain-containing protein [Aspergillus homomorphus CBS 101889]|uniref:BTB domain-containing protein n=1 Tax=Aspergillus homomorphus (strain CBS 101889) TaxID=1450537 RepID=A0A395IAK6_ASPHC|nr:hypothetical protein BO97DRAFT_385455 [Aspergillus homomorphus CBS 101889]RAL15184.1 hypothetical protein BO97DRAFT_385455 [Aspergillus homomorphus CBS 101889]